MKTITIVGVGALGSHVAQFLRNTAKLRVIDFDRVEQKNVLSQFHARSSLGRAKVVALQQTLAFLFGTKIDVVPHQLVDGNAQQLLGNAELVVDCLDNFDARTVIQRFVRNHGVPCLHGALAADGSFGRVIWDEEFSIDGEHAAGAATCEDGAHLPLIGLVACYVARAAQEFLATGQRLGFAVPARSAATFV
jgi:molybdopterin/thiamine biosynthesis adenylyltransferase